MKRESGEHEEGGKEGDGSYGGPKRDKFVYGFYDV